MNDFSLFEKINILMELISSSSLFLICSIVGIILLIFLIVCIILNKKVNKFIFISVFSFIGILILINYGATVFKVLDAIIDSVFMALYFPSLPVYAFVLLSSNVCFVVSIFNRRQTKFRKIINIVNSVLLDFILILVMDTVNKFNINIYEEITLYTNSTLLVLLELSMGIFTSWILVNLILSAHLKLKKYDEKEYPEMPEIIFD